MFRSCFLTVFGGGHIFGFFYQRLWITIMKERIWINFVSSEIVISVFSCRHCPVAR